MTGIIMPVYGAGTPTPPPPPPPVSPPPVSPPPVSPPPVSPPPVSPPPGCSTQNAYIGGVSPGSGAPGTTFTISGFFPIQASTGSRITNVIFEPTTYVGYSATDSAITVTVPNLTAGTYTVQAYNGCTPLLSPVSFTITTGGGVIVYPSITSTSESSTCTSIAIQWSGLNFQSWKVQSSTGWHSPVTGNGSGSVGPIGLFVGSCSTTKTSTIYVYSDLNQQGTVASQAFTISTLSCIDPSCSASPPPASPPPVSPPPASPPPAVLYCCGVPYDPLNCFCSGCLVGC